MHERGVTWQPTSWLPRVSEWRGRHYGAHHTDDVKRITAASPGDPSGGMIWPSTGQRPTKSPSGKSGFLVGVDLETIDAACRIVEQLRFVRRRVGGGQALERVPQDCVAAADFVHREIRLEHAAVGAEF